MSEELRSRRRGRRNARWSDAFDIVMELGSTLPNVEAATKYDASPVLRVHGVFMAGLAMHASAEPDTVVVRVGFEEREGLLEDAPETYCVTDYYRRYPVVLVRLALLNREVLRELLVGSWRITAAKGRKGRTTTTKMPAATQFGGVGPP